MISDHPLTLLEHLDAKNIWTIQLKMVIGLLRMMVPEAICYLLSARLMMMMVIMMLMKVVVTMSGLRMTVPSAIWCPAEGSKKTRLSDPTVKHLQLHHAIPNHTIHLRTYTRRRAPTRREEKR